MTVAAPTCLGATPVTVTFVGGADLHLRIPLIHALAERDIRVSVIATAGRERFEAEHIRFYPSGMGRGVTPWRDARLLFRMRRLMESTAPDLVHGFGTKPALLVPLATAPQSDFRAVRTVAGRGRLFSDPSLKLAPFRLVHDRMQRRASRRATATVFQNSDDQAHFLARGLVDPDKAILIRGSGIDGALVRAAAERAAASPPPWPIGNPRPFVALMVARLLWSKGVGEFLTAAEMLPANKFLCVLAGPVAEQGRSAARMEHAISAAPVTYLGRREDVAGLMRAADATVLPTYYGEGVPRVLLEAAVLGSPIVTTDYPGCRDVVAGGTAGTVIPARDASALAQALQTLRGDRERAATMASAARSLVEREFSLQAVADAHAALYRRLVHARRPGMVPKGQ